MLDGRIASLPSKFLQALKKRDEKAMKESIENRRWVCGFPDKFVIIKVNGYVVSAFGAADLIDTFKSKTLKAYQDAKVYCEENIE